MPLESLRQPFNPDEPGRKLREVQTEHEEKHENPFEWEAHLNALKQNTALYDGEKNLWRMENTLDPIEEAYFAFDQLLEIYIQANVDAEEAKEEYDDLVHREEMKDAIMITDPPLLGRTMIDFSLQVILQKKFPAHSQDTRAQNFFTSNKHNLPEQDRWHKNHYRSSFMGENISVFQLIPLYADVVSGGISEEQAKKYFAEYEARFKKNGMWKSDNHASSEQYTSSEFAVILLETEWDLQKAREHFEALTHTDLYDEQENLWYTGSKTRSYMPSVQLMAVLIEQKLKIPNIKISKPPQIPEERNF